jgi:hypothetical protein
MAMLELKSALEEDVATRLGLDRTLPPDELAARAQAEGLLDAAQARDLARTLVMLGGMEVAFSGQHGTRRRAVERVRDAEVFAVAARVRELLDAVGAARP